MLKKFTFRKFAISSLLLLLAFILYNYPEEINTSKQNDNASSFINVYLIDRNDLVSLTKIKSVGENTNDYIKSIINSLIIGNNDEIPNGFSAIIPKGTKLIEFVLENNLLKLNFSKEFLNVSYDDEEKMIEAIIYSLTTLPGIENIMIFVENNLLLELPNSHKKLDPYLNKSFGINKVVDISTFKNTQNVTVYYLSKNINYYYIPVTYITDNDLDKIEIIINSLKSNKFNSSNLLSHLDYQVELMNYEADENFFLLNFNNVFLNNIYDGQLKEEVKYALSYSIIDTFGVENVVFQVNSQKIDEFILEK